MNKMIYLFVAQIVDEIIRTSSIMGKPAAFSDASIGGSYKQDDDP